MALIHEIRSPQDLPEPNKQHSLEEPYVRAMIIAPAEYTGAIMELVQSRRGELDHLHYLSPERVELVYQLPLADVVFDFFDAVKSRTRGYASLDYEPSDYRPSDLVRVDILLNEQPVDAFSTITHRDKAAAYGRRMVEREAHPPPALRRPRPGGQRWPDHRPRDHQGAAQGRHRQVLRRRYHPEAEAAGAPEGGKKRMKMVGSVEVPQEAFIAALKVES